MHAARHPGEELGAGMKVAEHAIMPGDSDLLLRQAELCRKDEMCSGHIFFSYSYMLF